MEIERVLVAKTDKIVEKWLETARQDRQLESTKGLDRKKLQDSIPDLIAAIAKGLSDRIDEPQDSATQKADLHGVLRAQQNFDPEEIAREFFLLRKIIIAEIKSELIYSAPLEIVDIIVAIDTTLDYFVAQSFKTYTQQKLKQLEQLQHQLLLTNQELTRLIEAHKDSFSYLTHEIKSPLTSILGYSDLFLRQSQQNQEHNNSTANLRHIEQVLTQGRKILRIVNDSLEFANYQAGTMKLNWETIDVYSLLDNVILTLKPQANAKKLQLNLSCPQKLKFTTDSLRLQQISINLVTNAIRYTKSGTIRVTCYLEPEWLKIIVVDTGIGIPQEYHSCIFEPYFRVKHQGSYVLESRGLGLSIVGQLVKMLRGKIWVDSEVGVGSTFTVVLPKISSSHQN